MVRPKTKERLRVVEMIDQTTTVHLTYSDRDVALRKAMAGEQVLRPIELFIFMGGDPDNFRDQDARECVRILRRFGYKPDRAALSFWESVERVFIRTDRWPEDDYWDEQAKLARESLLAKIGLLDILEEAADIDADSCVVARAEAARAVD